MFVNWLSNNVLRFGALLYPAGMMLSWLLPDRAEAHTYVYPSYWSDCIFPNRTQAEARALRKLRDKCNEVGSLVRASARGGMCLAWNQETESWEYKYEGYGWAICRLKPHEHKAPTVIADAGS